MPVWKQPKVWAGAKTIRSQKQWTNESDLCRYGRFIELYVPTFGVRPEFWEVQSRSTCTFAYGAEKCDPTLCALRRTHTQDSFIQTCERSWWVLMRWHQTCIASLYEVNRLHSQLKTCFQYLPLCFICSHLLSDESTHNKANNKTPVIDLSPAFEKYDTHSTKNPTV